MVATYEKVPPGILALARRKTSLKELIKANVQIKRDYERTVVEAGLNRKHIILLKSLLAGLAACRAWIEEVEIRDALWYRTHYGKTIQGSAGIGKTMSSYLLAIELRSEASTKRAELEKTLLLLGYFIEIEADPFSTESWRCLVPIVRHLFGLGIRSADPGPDCQVIYRAIRERFYRLLKKHGINKKELENKRSKKHAVNKERYHQLIALARDHLRQVHAT